nr:hypothetical protein [Calditrichia bacterium]
MKPKYLIGGLIIIAFTAYAMMSFEDSMVSYVSFQEAANTGKVVQVKGTRVPDSDTYDMEEKLFKFQIADENGTVFNVVY